MRKVTVVGCVLWIAGLVASIVGLNLQGDAGRWVSIVGNIVFLLGLGIIGAVWFRKKRLEEESPEKEQQEKGRQ